MVSWWRPTSGATRLGVWTRPPALYSPWREPGVVVCVSPSHMCRLRAPRMLERGASVQPWIGLALFCCPHVIPSRGSGSSRVTRNTAAGGRRRCVRCAWMHPSIVAWYRAVTSACVEACAAAAAHTKRRPRRGSRRSPAFHNVPQPAPRVTWKALRPSRCAPREPTTSQPPPTSTLLSAPRVSREDTGA